MALDPGAEELPVGLKQRGTDSSRLAALRLLRAAHADLGARLGRPPLRLTHRYRDLVLVTRLIELELDHLAGRTALDASAAKPTQDADDSTEQDPGWSDSWGLATRRELHTELGLHSRRRERLDGMLRQQSRAKAAADANLRYERIAQSIPWRAPATAPSTASAVADVVREPAAPIRPPAPAEPAPADRAPADPAPPEPAPALSVATRPRKERSPWLVQALVLTVAALLAVMLSIDGPGRQTLDGGADLEVPSEANPSVPASPAPVVAGSPVGERGRSRERPERERAARPPDSGGSGGVSPADGEPATATATATPVSVPAPAPTSAAPEPAPPAPAPAPAEQPAEPAPESPPEFGFEH